MRKILFGAALVLAFAASVQAGVFFTLGYDNQMLGKNDLLASGSENAMYFNGDIGYLWDSGINISLKYDHIDMEDFDVSGENARVICPISYLGLGYTLKFMDGKLAWWTTVYAGNAVEARYRINVTNYRTNGNAAAATTGLYYYLWGQYFGIEAGYRTLTLNYTDIQGSPNLNMSGVYMGIEYKHEFDNK